MKETTKNWMDFTLRDIKAANELRDNEFYSNIVCFHSQQAVEKAIKAILEEFSILIPRTHNVLKLYSLLPEKIKSELCIDKNELSDIDEIYSETKYPSELGLLTYGFPSKHTAIKFYNISKNIVDKIKNIIQ